MSALSLDGAFWLGAARWGASRLPEWFVRAAPPAIAMLVLALAPERRQRVVKNLHLLRGQRGKLRDALDAARTFAAYASCLTEVLGAGSPHLRAPQVLVHGELHALEAIALGRGVILVSAHTGGWEMVGPVLTRELGLEVMVAMSPEPDRKAREIQDDARRAHGLLVTHVGQDPLAALPLVRHLRQGGAVAILIDRLPPGQRRRAVRRFGRPGHIPEGPLRLAAATGAPLLPVFAARTGHLAYEVRVSAPIRLSRAATPEDLDQAAQTCSDAMDRFLRDHVTQWFHFEETREAREASDGLDASAPASLG